MFRAQYAGRSLMEEQTESTTSSPLSWGRSPGGLSSLGVTNRGLKRLDRNYWTKEKGCCVVLQS